MAVDNVGKFRLERSTSNQETIDIGLGRQTRGSGRVGRTSVQDTSFFGDRGTGKSTAVRALAALLPEISKLEGSPTNAATDAEG